MDNYKAIVEEQARVLEAMKNTDPNSEEYFKYLNRLKELETARKSQHRDAEHKDARKQAAVRDGVELGLEAIKIVAGVGLVLVGFCFEKDDSLGGFFAKAVMPNIGGLLRIK